LDPVGGKTDVSAAIKAQKRPGRAKYGSTFAEVDGIKFRSKHEAKCWGRLTLAERAGQIRNLRRQVRYPLHAEGGNLVGGYDADFVYDERTDDGWALVVADAKGFPTPLYEWKKRHMLAEHGIEIREL
jgi:hypothetical protein